jgi:integrase
MASFPYLQKSSHGTYYFRAVIPVPIRRSLNLKAREIRISLRTKNLHLAKRLLAQKLYVMSKTFPDDYPQPWEEDAEKRVRLFQKGMRLLRQYGHVDLDDEFARDGLLQDLGSEDLEAYLFALKHQREKETESHTSSLPQPVAALPPTPSAASAQTHVKAETLRLMADAPLAEAIDRYIDSIRHSIALGTVNKYRSQCLVFMNIITQGKPDIAVSQISPQHIQAYVDRLPKLPRKTLPSQALCAPDVVPGSREAKSAKTIFHHAAAIKALLDWLDSQKYDVAQGLSSILKPLLRKPKKPRNRVLRFEPAQLKAIFESASYRDGSFKRASDYWVPLIGLYSGAREAEICQLKLDDIRKWDEGGFWYMDINDQGGGKLKTESSARQVPLHPNLIRLGLLDYQAWLKKSGRSSMFEDEERNKYGHFVAFSKRFNRFRGKLGIVAGVDEKLDFHSFRHTLTSALMKKGHEEYAINDITGHSNRQRGLAHQAYGDKVIMSKKYELISSLDFGIEIALIKPNGFVGWKKRPNGQDWGDP